MATGIAAVRRRNLQIVVIVDVAGGARHVRVPVRQLESRRAVIEFCSQPTVKTVTALTIRGRKYGWIRLVRRIRGVLPILQVAGIALCRQSEINARRRALVAFRAIYRGMCPQKRESVLVILQLLRCHIPALNRVALCAVRSELPPVDVSVAVRAILAHIRENWLYVAQSASHLLVHPAQWVRGLVVIEFRCGLDRSPARRGVAILARNRQRSMGIPRGLILCTRNWASGHGSIGGWYAARYGERQ